MRRQASHIVFSSHIQEMFSIPSSNNKELRYPQYDIRLDFESILGTLSVKIKFVAILRPVPYVVFPHIALYHPRDVRFGALLPSVSAPHLNLCTG